MISHLSTHHHRAAEASSLSFVAAANAAAEPHPASRDPEGDGRKSLTPSLSTWPSSETAHTQLHDPAGQSGPVLSQPSAVGRPARSPTIRPPPNAVLPGYLYGRCSHVCLASRATMPASGDTAGVRLQGSATTSSASVHTSDMTTTHSSTPPPYALVMDSLVRRYRAEEDHLSQWRQGGGHFRASAPFRHGSAQLRHRPGGAVEGEGLPHAGLRGCAGDILSGHRGRDADSDPRGALSSVAQRLALLRAVQAWWRRRVQPRIAGKASKSLYRAKLPFSAAAVADAETLCLSETTDAPVPLTAAARSVSSGSRMDRVGHRVLDCLSHSLSLSSHRGKSIALELLRPADTAQPLGTQRSDHDDTVHDSLEEEQRPPGAEMAELTAEAMPAAVVAPALSLSCSEGGTALTHPLQNKLERAAGVGGGSAHRRQPVYNEQGVKYVGYSDITASSSCSSRGSSVRGGDGAVHSTEASGAADHRQKAGPAVRHDADGNFMLSWFRALRMDRLCGAAASSSDDAEVVFGGAPHLLERSRARLLRWLGRRRRHRAARRSLRGGGARSKTAVDVEPFDEPSGVQYSTSAPPPFSTTSELHRHAAQAVPSPWEEAVPPIRADWSGSKNTLWDGGVAQGASAAAERPTRAPILEWLRAAVAAETAGWNVQQGGLVEPGTVSEVPSSDDEAPVLSPAAQRAREHANDLARLAESLRILTRCTERSTTDAGSGIHAHGANDPEDVKCAPSTIVDRERTDTAALSHPSASKASIWALPAWSPFRAHAMSIISAGQHCRSYHGDSRIFCDAEPRARDGKSHLHAAEEQATVDAFRSLLTDATHTSHNVAVRAVYEAIMSEVCTPLVRRDVENAIDVSRSAADRALAQWVERQLIVELTQPRPREEQLTAEEPKSAAFSAVTLQPLVFTGVTQHIRSGVPVSLDYLRLDDFDRQVLESVKVRSASDAIAVKFDTGGYDISYRQLSSLGSQSWLNDQVINNYLQLLCVEAEGAAAGKDAAAERRHRIACLGTHFYTKAESDLRRRSGGVIDLPSCLPQLDSGSATFRWLRNRQQLLEPYSPSDPRSVRVVLAPVNIEAQHWALAVFYRADNRWVMYDSMSRSGTARQRGAMILTHLSHVWRECQRHFGIVRTEDTTTAEHSRSSAAPQLSPWVSACLVAAPYVPFTDTLVMKGRSTVVSPLDSLEPYDSLDQLYRAAKRMRRQEELFVEEAAQRSLQAASDAGRDGGGVGIVPTASATPVPQRPPLPLTAATTIPAVQLSDTEVEWFTGGFDRVPQQANGNDCGVFVCQAAWCVAQGVAVSFAQSDVTRLREVILLELFNKRLLRRYPTANTSSSAGV